MLDSIQDAQYLGDSKNICSEDIILIALNACGLRNKVDSPRLRLRLRMDAKPDIEFRFILSTNRWQSPFHIDSGKLYLSGDVVAEIYECRDDNAITGYFRRQGTVMTLNSNSRSHCTGCVFCPNTLEGASDPPHRETDDLVQSFKALARAQGKKDLSHLIEVNLSTGCFPSEEETIDHILMVRSALKELHSEPVIGFLSSELRTEGAFKTLIREINKFHLILTVECFSNRNKILRSSKSSLTVDLMPKLLESAKKSGCETDFTYIVGLDELELACQQIEKLVPHLTRFPNFQVYQPHNGLMDQYQAHGAESLTFYLDFRLQMEKLFSQTAMRPMGWENYRPLWYFEFAGEQLSESRC